MKKCLKSVKNNPCSNPEMVIEETSEEKCIGDPQFNIQESLQENQRDLNKTEVLYLDQNNADATSHRDEMIPITGLGDAISDSASWPNLTPKIQGDQRATKSKRTWILLWRSRITIFYDIFIQKAWIWRSSEAALAVLLGFHWQGFLFLLQALWLDSKTIPCTWGLEWLVARVSASLVSWNVTSSFQFLSNVSWNRAKAKTE